MLVVTTNHKYAKALSRNVLLIQGKNQEASVAGLSILG